MTKDNNFTDITTYHKYFFSATQYKIFSVVFYLLKGSVFWLQQFGRTYSLSSSQSSHSLNTAVSSSNTNIFRIIDNILELSEGTLPHGKHKHCLKACLCCTGFIWLKRPLCNESRGWKWGQYRGIINESGSKLLKLSISP